MAQLLRPFLLFLVLAIAVAPFNVVKADDTDCPTQEEELFNLKISVVNLGIAMQLREIVTLFELAQALHADETADLIAHHAGRTALFSAFDQVLEWADLIVEREEPDDTPVEVAIYNNAVLFAGSVKEYVSVFREMLADSATYDEFDDPEGKEAIPGIEGVVNLDLEAVCAELAEWDVDEVVTVTPSATARSTSRTTTVTPTVTRTSIRGTPSPTPELGTRTNPVPVGQGWQFEKGLFAKRAYVISVHRVLRGAAARAIMGDFFEEPPTGYDYILVSLRVRYVSGPGDATLLTSEGGHRFYASNRLWGGPFLSIPPHPEFEGQNIFQGATITGWLSPKYMPTRLLDEALLEYDDVYFELP